MLPFRTALGLVIAAIALVAACYDNPVHGQVRIENRDDHTYLLAFQSEPPTSLIRGQSTGIMSLGFNGRPSGWIRVIDADSCRELDQFEISSALIRVVIAGGRVASVEQGVDLSGLPRSDGELPTTRLCRGGG